MKESAGRGGANLVFAVIGEVLLLVGVGVPALALLMPSQRSARRYLVRTAIGLQQAEVYSPRSRVDITMPKIEGRVINVSSEKDLQKALDEARPGDEVALKPGAEFRGSFVLPRKGNAGGNESGWIIVTSAQAQLNPERGVRISPASASRFPRLVSTNAEPALRAAPGAGYYRIIGLELTVAPSVKINYGIVRLGEGSELSADDLPHHITVDRCYIHGLPTSNIRRGIALNCAASAVIDSWISDCHEAGADSQAICCWNGPGPFEISGNYLEAAGENVMFGGADPSIPMLVPSDITFTRNYCRKPPSWRVLSGSSESKWSVKNLFELKNAERVLIENNVFDNNWVDAQTGYAILFKSVNQDGKAPWSKTGNVIFRANIVRHVSSAINIQGSDPDNKSGRTALILIQNNFLQDIDSNHWGGEGAFIKISGAADVHVDHNTALGTGSILIAYGDPNQRFVFTNNVVSNNTYGIKGDSVSSGTATLDKFFPGSTVSGNLIIGGSPSSYPSGNCFAPRLLDRDGAVRAATPDGCPNKYPGCQLDEAAVLAAARTADVETPH